LDPDDDLPIFRPRIGKRTPRGVRGRWGSLRNEVLARVSLNGGVQRRASTGPLRADAHRTDARRVVVKARVVRLTAYGAKAAAMHLRYIERDGVEKDGSKGALYGPDGPVRRRTFEEPRFHEKHQFRLIVSPEDAGELDLTAYVRRLMGQIERDLGRKVEWAAVNHYDTGHPHAHIVVRGVDRDGHELRFDRSYIASGMRWRAQEIATQELGPRHEFEIQRAHAREITQERFTSLDRELERLSKDGRLELRSPKPRTRMDPSTLCSRLEHLEAMGLAERLSSNAWSFSEGWQKALRDLGTRNDIIKQIHEVVRGDSSRYRIVRAGEPLLTRVDAGQQKLVGRVAGKGLSDEEKGTYYAVIEAPNGFAYHVPLAAKAAEGMAPGDLVLFGTRPELAVRPMDRRIAETAREARGVYALDRVVDEGDRARVARRLGELEREGLVRAEGSGRWTVPADFIQRLESRPRTEPPRERLWLEKLPLSIEQTPSHRGPVWLDQLDEATLAPWGFGADVARAVDERRVALRALGIAPEDPRRDAKLREVERQAVGEGMAARTGQEFLARTPDGFRGWVQMGPVGAPYAVVSDGARFVLVPASQEIRGLAGKTVSIARDGNGRLTIRAPDKDLDR
jgi:type IV secretory pathway VirD2 relaxase